MSDASLDEMRPDGQAEAAVATFAHYQDLLRSGDEGVLREASLDRLTPTPENFDVFNRYIVR